LNHHELSRPEIGSKLQSATRSVCRSTSQWLIQTGENGFNPMAISIENSRFDDKVKIFERAHSTDRHECMTSHLTMCFRLLGNNPTGLDGVTELV